MAHPVGALLAAVLALSAASSALAWQQDVDDLMYWLKRNGYSAFAQAIYSTGEPAPLTAFAQAVCFTGDPSWHPSPPLPRPCTAPTGQHRATPLLLLRPPTAVVAQPGTSLPSHSAERRVEQGLLLLIPDSCTQARPFFFFLLFPLLLSLCRPAEDSGAHARGGQQDHNSGSHQQSFLVLQGTRLLHPSQDSTVSAHSQRMLLWKENYQRPNWKAGMLSLLHSSIPPQVTQCWYLLSFPLAVFALKCSCNIVALAHVLWVTLALATLGICVVQKFRVSVARGVSYQPRPWAALLWVTAQAFATAITLILSLYCTVYCGVCYGSLPWQFDSAVPDRHGCPCGEEEEQSPEAGD